MSYDNWLTEPHESACRDSYAREEAAEHFMDEECPVCGQTGDTNWNGEYGEDAGAAPCDACAKPCKGCKEKNVEKPWRGRCLCCKEYSKRGKKQRRQDAAYPNRKARKRNYAFKKRFEKQHLT